VGCSTTAISNIKLPEYLAFFGGRRFVPIAAGVAGVLALVFGFGWGIPGRRGRRPQPSGHRPRAMSACFVYGALNRIC
jgi:PTS system N-acetylglucosamine-specific IIC component